MPIFLYTFLGKMDKSGEENRRVPVFLSTFQEKAVFTVEENKGMPVFLPFFDKNVIFAVEENEGVAVFLYTSAQNHQRTTAKWSWPPADDLIQAEAPLQGRFHIE